MAPPKQRKPGLYGRPRGTSGRRRRTIEGEHVQTPIDLIAAARDVPGWALHDHDTIRRSDGSIVAMFTMYHRGGIVVNCQSFRDAFLPPRMTAYKLTNLHDIVDKGIARVYVTMREA